MKTSLTRDKQLSSSETMNPVDFAFWNLVSRSIVGAFRSTKDDGSTKLPWNSDVCSTGNFLATPADAKEKLGKFSDKLAMDKSFRRSYDMDYVFQVDMEMSLERYKISNRKVDKRELGKWSNGSWKATDGEKFTIYGTVQIYRIVVVEEAPFVVKVKHPNGTVTFDGFCIDLLKQLQELLGFEYELYESPDGLYGSLSDNGTWNGMIKEIKDQKADIALAALSVTGERKTVVDFTIPYYDLVGITILMKKPVIPTSLFKFLTVLENDVWACILAAYFVTALILWLFDRFSPYSFTNDPERYIDDDEKREFNLKESLWFCMTSLTPQGGGEAPKHLSGRLVAATWWLFAFIVVASYTANLAAFLTVSRLDTPIKSFDELTEQYKVKYAPLKGSSTMTYFRRMAGIERKFYEIWKELSLDDNIPEFERSKLAVWDYPVSDKYTKMLQIMEDTQLPASISEALDRVRNTTSDGEGFAFLGDGTIIRYLVLTNCDLMMVGEEFSRRSYALAVQDGSLLKDQLNEALLKLLNLYRLEDLKEKWWTENPNKAECPPDVSVTEGISIENIGGVFVIIFIGIALSIITLIIEYIYYKYFYKEDKNDDKSAVSASTVVATSSEKKKSSHFDQKITRDEVYPVTAW
ncbi:ionotropic receptor 25a-like isoform X2 [Artemia franciscana]